MRVALIVLACLPFTAQDNKAVYYLPWPDGKSYGCVQGNNDPRTHSGTSAYAFDFGMPIGTKISAARSGRVVAIKEDSNEGGAGAKYMNKSNYVRIDHGDGTVGGYAHLKQNGALVEVGDWVFRGEVIGLSGQTGWASGPHLHFMVTQGSQSIPIRFVEAGVPGRGSRCTSANKNPVTKTVKDKINRLEKRAKMAWEIKAYGAAHKAYTELSKLDISVRHPQVEAAADRLKEIKKQFDGDLQKAKAALDGGRLAEAARMLLTSERIWKGTTLVRKIEPVLETAREKDGFKDEEKKLEPLVDSCDRYMRGIEQEVRGSFGGAAKAYKDCLKIDPETEYTRLARQRLANVESKAKAGGTGPAGGKRSPFGARKR